MPSSRGRRITRQVDGIRSWLSGDTGIAFCHDGRLDLVDLLAGDGHAPIVIGVPCGVAVNGATIVGVIGGKVEHVMGEIVAPKRINTPCHRLAGGAGFRDGRFGNGGCCFLFPALSLIDAHANIAVTLKIMNHAVTFPSKKAPGAVRGTVCVPPVSRKAALTDFVLPLLFHGRLGVDFTISRNPIHLAVAIGKSDWGEKHGAHKYRV